MLNLSDEVKQQMVNALLDFKRMAEMVQRVGETIEAITLNPNWRSANLIHLSKEIARKGQELMNELDLNNDV